MINDVGREADRPDRGQAAVVGPSLDCVIAFDPAGRIVDFNPAAEQTFGYPRAEVLGRLMAEVIVPPFLLERHLASIRMLEEDAGDSLLGRRLETFAMRADGSEFPVEVKVASVDLPGTPLFIAHLRNLVEEVYEGSPNGSNGAHAETTASQLRRAVRDGRFVLHYQPVVDLVTGRVVAAEALVRWDHPGRGLVPPDEFIHLAEDIGLIVPIGDWVLGEVLRQARAWDREGSRVVLSFNLSPKQLLDSGFASRLLDRLAEQAFDPARLVAEITETGTMRDPERTWVSLQTLREGGIRLAIDDFGTGQSSLSRLRDLPADVLKIDRSFVRDCPGSLEACAMVCAVIDMALRLGISPLAEGIETEEQRRFLVEQGCLLGQGFRFSRPVPPQQLLELASAGAWPLRSL